MIKVPLAIGTLVTAGILVSALPAEADEPLHLTHTMMTSGANLSLGKRVPLQAFSQQDFVVQLADFAWDPVEMSGGKHDVVWRWYQDDRLLSQTAKSLDFNSTPNTLWTKRAASTLGSGHFRIETIIDGMVITTSEFDIAPAKAQ
jgi:hypothetical protein